MYTSCHTCLSTSCSSVSLCTVKPGRELLIISHCELRQNDEFILEHYSCNHHITTLLQYNEQLLPTKKKTLGHDCAGAVDEWRPQKLPH